MSHHEIARFALEFAHAADPTFPAPTEARTKAWVAVFESQPVCPQEARAAVLDHYAKSAKRLTPNVIVDHCKKQQVWSSVEHINWWLDVWCLRHPFAPFIAEYSGIQPPEFSKAPSGASLEEQKKLAAAELAPWIEENRQTLIEAIQKRRIKRPQ